MQRVRIGLTGLAFVFVLVLLAAVEAAADPFQDNCTIVAIRCAPGPSNPT